MPQATANAGLFVREGLINTAQNNLRSTSLCNRSTASARRSGACDTSRDMAADQ
jgi:hypothetical protein